jgi:ATP-dependent DNA helicase recQ
MSDFIRLFKEKGNLSFIGMRDTAESLLPANRAERDKLHHDLDRGKGVLDDENHLNMYLHSFGKMHKAKLEAAFDAIPNFAQLLTEEFEIYDWGCGQGTATICLLDFLSSHKITPKLLNINLIEPSKAAVKRASEVVACINPNYTVRTITKDFDSLCVDDFEKSNYRKIHLFSNILDVEGFDLAKFIYLFQKSFNAANTFICIGPYYSNSRRIGEFIAATDPDEMFAIMDKDKGEWLNQWTISLRIFDKAFERVEAIRDIRKRIEESHKQDQFFAGYVLDSVAEEYQDFEYSNEAESLYRALSVFDVKSNIQLGVYDKFDAQFAVLANIISRGLPTKAPIFLEDTFSDLFGVSEKPVEGANLNYDSKHSIPAQQIYEALHIVDPRFNIEYYNGDMLESSFEKSFIEQTLKDCKNEYLIQVLEPLRPLSTIIEIPDRNFHKEQRVDFAMNIPYGESRTGFIIEKDAKVYHSNIFQRHRDEQRDSSSTEQGWYTYHIKVLKDISFLHNWREKESANQYLQILEKNSRKELSGAWKDTLQIVLSPLAIARLERVLIETLMAGCLKKNATEWNVAVVERDVPCAAIAVEVLQEKIKNIYSLSGKSNPLPKINLSVVSTAEFADSPLHLEQKVNLEIPHRHFDVCVDISMLLRDNIDALPLNIKADAVYIVRSSHYQKRHRTICSAESIQYPPLVVKDTTGKYVNIPEREKVLSYFLHDIFRKPSFRPGQLPIISHSLGDRTTIGLLPTGGGKSLTYQISCILQPGVSIVVDPLMSLMLDQVRGLRSIRIDVCECVNSSMSSMEKADKLNMLQRGAVLFMLLSPERFMMPNFRESLVSMTKKNHVYFSYGIIDEVHCVSEWGHDFRTSYLHLGRNMINFMHTKSKRPLSIIGLTATASFDVLADVERELTLGGNLTIDSEAVVRPENDTRPELAYRVIEVKADFDSLKESEQPYLLKAGVDEWDMKDVIAKAKIEEMSLLLDSIPSQLEEKNIHNSKCALENFEKECFYTSDEENKYPYAGIIFCPHAKGTFGVNNNDWGTREGISAVLRSKKDYLQIGTFVGGDQPSGHMSSFNNNDINVMVATKAFGMGIDKPNIRFTININHPSSIESYVQEAGRGGRDKKNAISYILYEPTEYIHLTIDKINDIRFYMGKDDPRWLEKYNDRYILSNDFTDFCKAEGATDEQAQKITEIIHRNGYLENVDKGIDLWFHNNSFRGLLKEKAILNEMTDRLLNIKPTYVVEIQGKLREIMGNDDICLKVNQLKNAITIFSKEENAKQYGFIFLDTLRPSYNYIGFEDEICSKITNALINILKTYSDHSAKGLLTPLDGGNNLTEGIYRAMSQADKDGYVYVTVSWENQIKQSPDDFKTMLKAEITNIAQKQNWNNIDENRYGPLQLNKIGNFNDLLTQIANCSNDSRWLRYHADEATYQKLKILFCRKRDKDDTDKAIYRLCCIGLVEDVTIDYLSETYELKIRNRSDQEFQQCMFDFFKKYYSSEQAEKKVAEIDNQKGRNYLDKCLGYLTAFVYTNLEKKRYRAIDDMRIACEDSITERYKSGNDDWLKEFIHLYFNSKYARKGYKFGDRHYSLMEDTDEQGLDGFEVVEKYIRAMTEDGSGSEVDNVKHLYGATLLCLRAHPENAALQLLLTYCITFLGVGNNETLKATAYNSYIEGFMSLYGTMGYGMWSVLEVFNEKLCAKVHDAYIQEEILNKGKDAIMLFIHEENFNKITKKYLNK